MASLLSGPLNAVFVFVVVQIVLSNSTLQHDVELLAVTIESLHKQFVILGLFKLWPKDLKV